MSWTFDVGVSSHDLLRKGVIVGAWHRVILSSEEYPEWIHASEAAILWGFYYGYVTDLLTIDWPDR